MTFSRAQDDPFLTTDAIEQLFKANPQMPEKLPLSLYTHVRDTEKTASIFANWAEAKVKASRADLTILAKSYLSSPPCFIDAAKGKSIDLISLYEACSRARGRMKCYQAKIVLLPKQQQNL
jgi:hypothetical protein